MPVTNWLISPSTWELHTDGLKGPSATGSFVATNFNTIAISYDPPSGTVVGSVQGVSTPALPFKVSGVKYIGFQGHGFVNDFRVVPGSITPQ
jgi:hypothetical protein